MAISPKCDKCGIELTEFGSILLGPPNESDMAKKYHLCIDCFQEIEKELLVD